MAVALYIAVAIVLRIYDEAINRSGDDNDKAYRDYWQDVDEEDRK